MIGTDLIGVRVRQIRGPDTGLRGVLIIRAVSSFNSGFYLLVETANHELASLSAFCVAIEPES